MCCVTRVLLFLSALSSCYRYCSVPTFSPFAFVFFFIFIILFLRCSMFNYFVLLACSCFFPPEFVLLTFSLFLSLSSPHSGHHRVQERLPAGRRRGDGGAAVWRRLADVEAGGGTHGDGWGPCVWWVEVVMLLYVYSCCTLSLYLSPSIYLSIYSSFYLSVYLFTHYTCMMVKNKAVIQQT